MITAYTTYDPKTGRIVRTGTSSDIDNEMAHTKADLRVLLVESDLTRQYVLNGQVVNFPEQPSPHHIFNYTTKQWQADPEAAWASVRQRRAQLLADSDWIVTKATEAGQLVPPEWVAYRQALRDITLQSDPWAIVWPVAPI